MARRSVSAVHTAPDEERVSFAIRAARETDAARIGQLAGELGYPLSAEVALERMRAIAGAPTELLLVACDNSDQAVGWLQAHAWNVIVLGFRVDILGLVVAGTHRRRGIARELMNEAERWAKSIGAETINLRSNVQRSESHSFYPALGYEAVKTQTAYRKKLAR